jgi:hypothetical protein
MISISLDECSDEDTVIRHLRALGRTIYSPRELGNVGADDEAQLQAATDRDAVFVTRNRKHFEPMYDRWLAESRHHAGILVVTPMSLAQRLAYLERASRLLTPEAASDQLMFLSLFATEWEARAYVTSLTNRQA